MGITKIYITSNIIMVDFLGGQKGVLAIRVDREQKCRKRLRMSSAEIINHRVRADDCHSHCGIQGKQRLFTLLCSQLSIPFYERIDLLVGSYELPAPRIPDPP